MAPSRTPQLIAGSVWLAMGLGTMAAPGTLLRMCVPKDRLPSDADGGADQPTLSLAFRCFGAQAAVSGALLLMSRLDRRGYALFAASIVPFFAFDYMAWRGGLINDLGAAADAAGNVVFIAAGLWGAGGVGSAVEALLGRLKDE